MHPITVDVLIIITSNTRKSEMQVRLMSYSIGYPERALKQELLPLIKLSNPKPKYVIDKMAKAARHEGSMYSTIPL